MNVFEAYSKVREEVVPDLVEKEKLKDDYELEKSAKESEVDINESDESVTKSGSTADCSNIE